MSKKLLIQIGLILLILFILYKFFQIYQKKNEVPIDLLEEKKIKEIVIDKNTKEGEIEGLEYISTDIEGNTYIVKAVSGLLNQDDPDLINLTEVSANLTFDNKDQIIVNSDYAVYNNNNFNTYLKGMSL